MSERGEGHDDDLRREAEQIVDAVWDRWSPPYRPDIVSAVEGVLRRWATATTRLAAAEEQLADANRGYSLLCDEEARLNDDLAAARRALDTAQEDARQGWASMHAVEQTAADAIMERDAVRRALEEKEGQLAESRLAQVGERRLAALIYDSHERVRAEEEDGPERAVWVPWDSQTSSRERRIYLAVAKEVLNALLAPERPRES